MFVSRKFPLFSTTPEGDNPPAPSPAPSPAPAPQVDEETKAKLAEFEKLKKDLESSQKKLADYAQKEQEELDKQKTNEQKLAEKEAELAKVKRESLVTKLAVKNGLDPDLIDRVRGNDEAEIAADIELLLQKFAAKETPGDGARGGRTPAGKAKSEEEEQTPSGKQAQELSDFNSWRSAALKK